MTEIEKELNRRANIIIRQEKRIAELEKENLKVKQGCHKWFMRWREVKRKELEVSSNIAGLEQQIEQFQKINKDQKETLKKVRVALIKERTANIMNYGKGGVEMFNDCFEILKGVSN